MTLAATMDEDRPALSSPCHICGEKELSEIAGFGSLPRVTSDCKPYGAGGRLAVCRSCGGLQKPTDARWQEEIGAIYRDYDIYFQSAGVEQSVFDPAKGVPRLRSQVLLERVDAVRRLGSTGSAIDIGCGKGTFLSAFQRFRPGWRLFGHELSRSNEAILSKIPGFEKLYVGPISEIPDKFDLITLVHALEHFDRPYEGLRDIADKLAPGGILVVEVPNGGISPFDLVVADHASHFSRDVLARVAQRAGLKPLVVADDWMAKELSMVAVKGEAAATPRLPVGDADALEQEVRKRVAWLRGALAHAREAAAGASQLGIFGTSIAGMWLFGELGREVDFFVDEDPSRIGQLNGRPVVTPRDIPQDATVFVALLPAIAASVAQRIARDDIRLVVPRPI